MLNGPVLVLRRNGQRCHEVIPQSADRRKDNCRKCGTALSLHEKRASYVEYEGPLAAALGGLCVGCRECRMEGARKG